MTGKVKLQLPQSREVKSVMFLTIAQMMSCFDLKMILTHGFIGSTCCFHIRTHCFAFSSMPLQMWVPRFFSSIFYVTLFFCFCFSSTFVSLLRSIIWIFHVMSFCAIIWIFHDVISEPGALNLSKICLNLSKLWGVLNLSKFCLNYV